MTNSRVTLFAGSLLLVLATASQTSAATLTTVTTQEPSKLIVQARNLGNGIVSGVIRNLSDDTINEVTLLIQHSWHWRNEFRPGPVEDNPGRTEFQTLSKSIEPGGSLEFHYAPSIPLPSRTDGHFETTVGVQEYTATGDASRSFIP
jgi:hypothetical protein